MTLTRNAQKILLAILVLSLAALACGKKNTRIDPRSFSVNQCACADIYLDFDEERSSASNNTYSTVLQPSNETIEFKGQLTCIWQESYQSTEKVGTISAYLHIYRIGEETQAKALYKSYQGNIESKPDYCKDDIHCSVTAQENGPERMLYAEANVYALHEDEILPSYHNATLLRNIYGPNDYYVVELTVDHPELEPESTYVIDTAATIEACLEPLAGK